MKHFAIHHIHVKCGKEIFTISHNGDNISLVELTHILTQIAEVCVCKNMKGGK